MRRNASAARFERCSCRKPSTTLSTTMTAISTAARTSPSTAETVASEMSSRFNGLTDRRANSTSTPS
ncbi:hypothetical protein DL770_011228 [Monosporascus sp. CRB-9-2]|nr:hypothetical protein DL770_011228 [Monosporascus sp. CRB-9-2]